MLSVNELPVYLRSLELQTECVIKNRILVCGFIYLGIYVTFYKLIVSRINFLSNTRQDLSIKTDLLSLKLEMKVTEAIWDILRILVTVCILMYIYIINSYALPCRTLSYSATPDIHLSDTK